MRLAIACTVGTLLGTGCLIDLQQSRHVEARVDFATGVACRPGDTIQLRAKNGSTVVEETTAPCSGAAELELTTSASIEAKLYASRGSPGLVDDIEIGEDDGDQGDGHYVIRVTKGFVVLKAGVLLGDAVSSCSEAGVAKLRVELADSQGMEKPTVSSFTCGEADMTSAPVRASRTYSLTAQALDASGTVIGEGSRMVAVPHGNAYVDAEVDVVVAPAMD